MGSWPIFDWTTLLLRWVHVIAGIAWIGSSFYFVALDASLRRNDRLDPGVGGESWQVHGGGFYRIQKYLVAPSFLPKELTWFMWEAYTTWIFGFALLVVVYYAQPELYLIDRSVADIGAANAVLIAAISLPIGWLIYDSLCRSALGRDQGRLAIAGFVLLVAANWGFTHIFGGRGAFMQIGALVGTIMVANVFLVIIPNQRKIVAALIAGQEPDPALGRQGKQRSLHNNYLTLPVVFLMVSNHYPSISAGPSNWIVVSGVFVAGFLVRHFFNTRHAGRTPQWWLLPSAALVGIALMLLTAPPRGDATPGSSTQAGSAPAFVAVQQIVSTRCQVCHSATPRFEGMASAPKGIMFDTPRQIAALAPQIYVQAVQSRAMPLNNLTGITEDERRTLAAWISAGSKIP
jgi:uncharacterized membrane protein